MTTVLVIGATGAQGAAVLRVLSSTGKYHLLALTRSATTERAKEIAALPGVELIPSGSSVGYNEASFSAAAARADAVFVNTDGFSLGEALETFWGIRLFELSAKAGVRHLIYSGLDSNQRTSNYNPDLYVGHYEGKARVQEWMHGQDKDATMAWTIIRSGPYAEMLNEALRPHQEPGGTYVFALPLGENGEMPFVSLESFGWYADWALSHRKEARGLDFGIAIEHVGLEKLAKAFTAVTGKKARAQPIPVQAWNEVAWAELPKKGDTKIGFASVKDDNALHMTYAQNFENWFNLYKASAGNKGLIQRDYEFLDRILPTRAKTIEDWMRRQDYTGDYKSVLKADAYRGSS
ncbi:NAD(P)-binding protein [Pleurostoma richardsiae]|uniref:NAD(P)-binding protein n=1 Tax=Pleurostoma richardsiae TaxID=41990 RepID=A0AA38RCC8_9PEZI|nr:NAD(P)-binding protein [Pleurostoma richardsiae]